MSEYSNDISTYLYKYREPVYITEPTGFRQQFIPIRLDLNINNFNFDLARSDGLDFRLSESSNGTGVLQMWVAYWNSTARIATVWFKLPDIQAAETKTMWAFWGYEYDAGISDLRYLTDESVEAMPNTPVFIFGDDFDGSSLDVNKWPSSKGGYTISNSQINLGATTWIRTGLVLGGQSTTYVGNPYLLPRAAGLWGNHQHTGACFLAYTGALNFTQSEAVDGNLTSYNIYSYVSGFGGCAIGVDLGSVRDKISKVRIYLYDQNENDFPSAEWNAVVNPWWSVYKSDTNVAGEQTLVYTYSYLEIPLVKYSTDLWYFEFNFDAPGETTRYFHFIGNDGVIPANLFKVYSEIEVYSDESNTVTTPGKFILEDGIVGIGAPSSTTIAAHRYRFYGGDNVMGVDYYWDGAVQRQLDVETADTYVIYAGTNKGLIASQYAQTYIGYNELTDRVYQGMRNRGGEQQPIYGDNMAVGGTAYASDAHSYKPPSSAFDGNKNTSWGAIQQSPSGTWIGYELPSTIVPSKVMLYSFGILGAYYSDYIDVEVQGSNDVVETIWDLKEWDALYSITIGNTPNDYEWAFDNTTAYIFIRVVYVWKAVGEPTLAELEVFETVDYSAEFDYDDSWERKVHKNTEVSNFRIYGENAAASNGVAIDWVIAREFTLGADPLVDISNLYVPYEAVSHQQLESVVYQSDVTSVDFYHTTDIGGDPYTMSDNVVDNPGRIFVSDEEVTAGSLVIDFGRNKYNITDNNYVHFDSTNTVLYYNAVKLSDADTDVWDRNYWQTTSISGWAAIEFPAAKNISSISFIAVPGSADRMPDNFKIYGSNSNPRFQGWNDKVLLYTGIAREVETEQVYYFNTGLTYYKYYILEVLDTHGGNVAIQEWGMFERDDTIGKKAIAQLRLHPAAFDNNEYFFAKEIELYASNDGFTWTELLTRTETPTPFVDYTYGRWSRYTVDNYNGYYLYKLVCHDNWRAAIDQIKIAEWEMVERVEEVTSHRILDGSSSSINNIWADPTTTINSGTLYMTNDMLNTVENEVLIEYTTLSGSVDDFNVKL